jgi:hypothetical protein
MTTEIIDYLIELHESDKEQAYTRSQLEELATCRKIDPQEFVGYSSSLVNIGRAYVGIRKIPAQDAYKIVVLPIPV